MNEPATSSSSPTETTGGGDASAAPLTSASNTTKPAPASPTTATAATNGTASAAAASATVEPQQQQQQHESKPSQSSTDEPQVASSVSLMNGEIPGSNNNNKTTTPLSSSTHNPTPIKPQPTAATLPLPITPEKPEKISRVQSASEIALSAQPKSVTIARKEELLEAARASRLEWIRHVPFPYDVDDTNQRNGVVDPLASLRETHAGRQLPAAMGVLEHLYGLKDNNDNDTAQAAQRIQELLREEAEQGAVRPKEAVPTPEQARKMALADEKDDETTTAQHNRNVLQSYHLFLQHLAEPAAAMLVQGMRNFCRNLWLKTTTTQQNTDKDQSTDNKSVLIHMLQSYVVSTLDTIRQHELWREDMETAEAIAASRNQSVTDDESLSSSVYMVQRSLQSFLYGQCRAHIDAVCFTTDTQTKEDEWEARVDALQFVTATHLEVACLQNESIDFVRTLLQEPVAALQSVPAHHAPFEKLQRVLALYRGINAALSQALNQNLDDDNAETKRLPSADDVLPAIILTVLQARPQNLQYHLQLMEDLLPPEALRGEAGYAFTNLYGAIQFIKDLNLENASGDSPESLNISAHDFQQGLDACRAAAREQMAKKAPNTEEPPQHDQPPRTPISAREIQTARAKGEILNVEWAVRQQQQKEPTPLDTLLDGGDEEADDEERAATAEPQQPTTTTTPSGYKRSYTFLSCQPQDIKVADLPLLLEEYRKMVHTTEELLAERQARVSSEKKQQFSKQYADLHARVQQVDPSLLADHTTSSPKKQPQPQQGSAKATSTITESPS